VRLFRRIAVSIRARTTRAVLTPLRKAERRVKLRRDLVLAKRRAADVAIFHELVPPPWGGGNQFVAALAGELDRRGLRIEWNTVSATTKACLVNKRDFDLERLRRFSRDDLRIVHRVDGPVVAYRGFDDGTDALTTAVNREYAQVTVFQSRYSLEQHRRMGVELRDPKVIPNAPDPALFNRDGRVDLNGGDVVRLIATSWSDNPNKGSDLVASLEAALDPNRFELTYVGRSPRTFERTRVVAPVGSAGVASLLRTHHVYLAFSRFEPCSNALLEALACGLPALYLESGSHAELVGAGGLGFDDPAEMPAVLDRLVAEWHERQRAIDFMPLQEVADRYLALLEL
jgi:glycosyltransferase involved in cell wall biosynthesis